MQNLVKSWQTIQKHAPENAWKCPEFAWKCLIVFSENGWKCLKAPDAPRKPKDSRSQSVNEIAAQITSKSVEKRLKRLARTCETNWIDALPRGLPWQRYMFTSRNASLFTKNVFTILVPLHAPFPKRNFGSPKTLYPKDLKQNCEHAARIANKLSKLRSNRISGTFKWGVRFSLWQANAAPIMERALILTKQTKWFEGRHVCHLRDARVRTRLPHKCRPPFRSPPVKKCPRIMNKRELAKHGFCGGGAPDCGVRQVLVNNPGKYFLQVYFRLFKEEGNCNCNEKDTKSSAWPCMQILVVKVWSRVWNRVWNCRCKLWKGAGEKLLGGWAGLNI